MGITVKNLVILVIIGGIGAYVFMNYGPKVDSKDFKPDDYSKAEGFFTLGKFDVAIPALEAAIKANPDDPRAEKSLYWIARAIDEDQRTDRAAQQAQALKAFKAYLAKYPNGEFKAKAKEKIDLLEAQGAK